MAHLNRKIVFCRQVHVGRGNKDFRICKLYSMRGGADKGSLLTIGGRDMSLICPRHEVRPGIIDPEDYYINVIMQEKIKLYLEYVAKHSFWYDIKLIFQTFWVIVNER